MPTKIWQGELDYIHPTVNDELRTLSLRLMVTNKNHLLKPNMWMTLTGDIRIAENILLVPKHALIRTQHETRVVMALSQDTTDQKTTEGENGGYFKSVAVKTGRVFNQQIEILSGLKEGDEVVTSAQFLIDSESNIDSDLVRMETHLDSMEGAHHDH